jgi:hypothetical protein
MESDAATTSANGKSEPIAPWWHTLLVLVPIAIGSIASWYEHGLPNAHLPGVSYRLSSYITVLLEEWFVVLLIWLALKRRGMSIGSLVSGHWQTLGVLQRFRASCRISCYRCPTGRWSDAPLSAFFWRQREQRAHRYHAQDSIRACGMAGNVRDGRFL